MSKSAILKVAVITVLLGAGYFALQVWHSDKVSEKSATELAKDLNVKSFSLGGDVVRIDGDLVTIKTSIARTINGEIKAVEEQKMVSFSSETKYYTLKPDGESLEASSRDKIKVGGQIVVYTEVYPYDVSQFPAHRVIINK